MPEKKNSTVRFSGHNIARDNIQQSKKEAKKKPDVATSKAFPAGVDDMQLSPPSPPKYNFCDAIAHSRNNADNSIVDKS